MSGPGSSSLPIFERRPMGFMLLSSLLVGGAVFVIARWFFAALLAEDDSVEAEWRYDRVRIAELKRHDALYRYFQPLFAGLGRINRAAFRGSLPAVSREIQAAGLPRFWLPEEYLARCELLALALLPALVASCIGIMGPVGIILALVLAGLIAWLLRRRLAVLARYRLTLIKRRLPFLLDLLTLLMEAGSSLLQALEEAVHEF